MIFRIWRDYLLSLGLEPDTTACRTRWYENPKDLKWCEGWETLKASRFSYLWAPQPCEFFSCHRDPRVWSVACGDVETRDLEPHAQYK